MWKLENLSVVVLISALTGCAILLNNWGSTVGVTISLIVVIYACVSLLANGNFLTPHALYVLEHINKSITNLYDLLKLLNHKVKVHAENFYQNHIAATMDRRRRNTYQLSSDSLVSRDGSSKLDIVGKIQPAQKNTRRSYISGSENNSWASPNSRAYETALSFEKTSSTPLARWGQREPPNINGILRSAQRSPNKNSTSFDGSHESFYSQNSSWGTSISPKMRGRAAGVKTVQTVAGPLLASTRYNIDSRMYTDVASPGFASRLSKYAIDSNMKLTHQAHYGTGQFPKVNLSTHPTPFINAQSSRMKSPVTVRIAPPDVTKYSTPERQKFLSDVCLAESKVSANVVQVLKESTLKRHASNDDVATDLVKKQRTDNILSEEVEEFEEVTQKRGRDESSKSEGELGIEYTPSRPTKRTKVPSCYDILHSLSSSTNFTTGTKRKNISRCGTPELGKHFKAYEGNLPRRSSNSSGINVELVSLDESVNKNDNATVQNKSAENNSAVKQLSESATLPTTSLSEEKISSDNQGKSLGPNDSVKLTDKLFMKAVPQNNDKLKSIIQQRDGDAGKFLGDGGDEIKKADVVKMRETSMKARLRSMFDAISGKSSTEIDPKVVIQAEDHPSEPVTNPPVIVSLNSTTSTTDVNHSPISTSALMPIIGKSKTTLTPGKHVSFQLSTAGNASTTTITTNSASPSLSALISSPQKLEEANKPEILEISKPSGLLNNSLTTKAPPTFNFGVPANTTPSVTTNTSVLTNTITNPVPSTALSVSSTFTAPALTSTSGTGTVAPTSVQQSESAFASSSPTVPAISSTTVMPSKPLFNIPAASTVTTQNTTFAVVPTMPTLPSNTTLSTSAPTSTKNMFTQNNNQLLFPGTSTNSTLPISRTQNSAYSLFSAPQSTSVAAVSSTEPLKPPVNSSVPVFIFKTDTTTATEGSAAPPTFTFGTNAPTTKPSFSFGSITTSQPTLTTPSMSFGNQSLPSSTAFGNTPTTTNAPASLFNTSTTASVLPNPTVTSPPLFSFGTPNAQQSTFSLTTTGSSTSTNTTTPQFATPKTETPSFGTPSSTTSSIFNGNNSIFGQAKSPLFGGTTAASTFGTNATPSFASNSSSLFPTQATTSVTFSTATSATSTSVSAFSTPTATSVFGTTNATPTSSFGTPATLGFASAKSSFGTAATSIFNKPNPSSAATSFSSSASPGFGAPNTALPAFSTSTTAPAFGSTTTTSTFGTNSAAPPSFGSTTTASAFGTTAAPPPAFGSTATAPPAFGSTTAPSAFGSNTTAPPAFGVSTTPAFGSATTATVSFGTTTSSAFGTPSAAPPAFGNTNTSFRSNSSTASPAFGSQNQSSSAPTFGASSTPAFGTAPSTSNSGMFSFNNASNPSQPQQQQQNTQFSFGGSSTSSGPTPFQYGSPNIPTGGFNFNGASSTPTSFSGSSGGGMFSIGAGSTTTRARATRTRKQQR